MNEIITVEDINSALMNLTDDFIYEIDTSKMVSGKTYQVDFITVTVTNTTKNGTSVIRYTFNIQNSLKSGGYAILDKTGSNTPFSASLGGNDELIIDIKTTSQGLMNIKLLMSNHYVFGETEINGISSSYFPIPYDFNADIVNKVFFTNAEQRKYEFIVESENATSINYSLTLYKLVWDSDLWEWVTEEIELTQYTIESIETNKIKVIFIFTPTLYDTYTDYIKFNHLYFKQVLVKQNNYIKLIQDELKNGKINDLSFNVIEQNKFITDDPKYDEASKLTISYEYLGEKLNDSLINNYIPIDLRNKIDPSPLKLKIGLNEGKFSNKYEHTFIIPCGYEAFTNSIATDLASENGTRIYKVYEDQTFEGTFTIGHDTIIQGEHYTIDSENGYTFIIEENVNIKIYNLNFINANPLFIQKENSSLELVNCTFTNCTANDYEGLGSIVHCDIEIENLDNPTDFITIIRESDFINCNGAILHSGELLVKDCNFLINTSENIIASAPHLLYQTDGSAILRGNTFDVTIEDNYFCENEINLKLAQCLFVCGENAVINNVNSKDLMNEENINLFGDYTNRSHIFLKYYYPQLETCVYVSPNPNREDKSLCYAISNLDYIFKYNVQVTRASWETENRINPINLGGD